MLALPLLPASKRSHLILIDTAICAVHLHSPFGRHLWL